MTAREKDTKNVEVIIKSEPGTSGLSKGRLPSFRGARDLTLGSLGNINLDIKPRKIYTPNLNVQRRKNKVEVKHVKEEAPKPKTNGREGDKDRGRGWDRGRGRERNAIQVSGGIFSEGFHIAQKNKGSRSGGGVGDRDYLPRPKLKLKEDLKLDKGEDDDIYRELTRDDFIQYDNLEPDYESSAVELPLPTFVKKIKGEVKPKVETFVNGQKIKEEIVEDEVDERFEDTADLDRLTLDDLLQAKTPQLVVLELPECLAEEDMTEQDTTSGPGRPSTSTGAPEPPEVKQRGFLNGYPEGCIGKLQILKSGKTRLILGEQVLNVNIDLLSCFKQDLFSVTTDPTNLSGEMVNLGPVQANLTCELSSEPSTAPANRP